MPSEGEWREMTGSEGRAGKEKRKTGEAGVPQDYWLLSREKGRGESERAA